jgi:CBS domain-containing membrane protein
MAAVPEPPPNPFARHVAATDPDRQPLEGLALASVQARFGSVRVLGFYALVNGLLAIGVMSTAALVTGAPLIFPSLGPTAYLLFSDPLSAGASPRNAVLGHLLGVLCGAGSLLAFGLFETGPQSSMAATSPRVGAAAMSLALTSALMVWFRLPHPPAAATTLIVSLGILHTTVDLAVLMLAVVALVALGLVISRLAGVPYPLWGPRRTPVEIRPAGMGGPHGGHG